GSGVAQGGPTFTPPDVPKRLKPPRASQPQLLNNNESSVLPTVGRMQQQMPNLPQSKPPKSSQQHLQSIKSATGKMAIEQSTQNNALLSPP
ncbi:calcium-activated potassium channel slowpoke-like, partial [Tropilaelaps mercedesae]